MQETRVRASPSNLIYLLRVCDRFFEKIGIEPYCICDTASHGDTNHTSHGKAGKCLIVDAWERPPHKLIKHKRNVEGKIQIYPIIELFNRRIMSREPFLVHNEQNDPSVHSH